MNDWLGGELLFLATPWLWLALPLLLYGYHRRAPQALPLAVPAPVLGEGPQRKRLPRSLRQRLHWLPRLLESLALAFLLVALGRPVVEVPLPPRHEGLAVMLCIDTSSSMAVQDLGDARDRLQVATAAAAEFARARPHDLIGLVSFARYADLWCPPTLDHEALAQILGRLELVASDSLEDATGIGGAVALAAAVLARQQPPGKVVILLTDGEENVATTATPQEIAPLHAAQLAQQLGVRVHGIVTGQGNPQPDGSFLPLDTTAVQQLASGSGGRFFTARDAMVLQQVYAAIDALEKVALRPAGLRRDECFVLPLLLSLLAALAAVLLRLTWLRRLW